MQTSFCDEFAVWAEREYSRAVMEYRHLVDLWEEARWFYSEVA